MRVLLGPERPSQSCPYRWPTRVHRRSPLEVSNPPNLSLVGALRLLPPGSRRVRVSSHPRKRGDVSPPAKRWPPFYPRSSSLSPNHCLRSLWPIATYLTCNARNIAALTSPVKAPALFPMYVLGAQLHGDGRLF